VYINLLSSVVFPRPVGARHWRRVWLEASSRGWV